MRIKFLVTFLFVILALSLGSVVSQDPSESASSSESTAASDGTTAASDGTTAASTESTAASDETTAASTASTAASGGTSAASTESTAASEGTSASSTASTAASGGTSAASTESTAASTETTATSTGTTASSTASTGTTSVTETTTTTDFSNDVKLSTQNLLGINCMVKATKNVEDMTQNFAYETQLCGSRVNSDAAKVINSADSLNIYTKAVEQANNNVCGNANYKPILDAGKTPSPKCVEDIQDSMINLNSNIDSTLAQVNTYFTQTSSFCAKLAILKFRLSLNQLSKRVKVCGRVAGIF